jgi:hypothetical protein
MLVHYHHYYCHLRRHFRQPQEWTSSDLQGKCLANGKLGRVKVFVKARSYSGYVRPPDLKIYISNLKMSEARRFFSFVKIQRDRSAPSKWQLACMLMQKQETRHHVPMSI